MKKTPLNIAIISQLLTETKLEPTTYIPSDNFKQQSHVAICMDEQPLMFIGINDDPEAHEVANRLLNNEHFITLTQKAFSIKFKKTLLKKMVVNDYFFHQREYMSLAESEQGKEIGMNDEPTLIVLFNLDEEFDKKDFMSYTITLCIYNSIMKCFFPNADNLSHQLSFINPQNIPFNDCVH